MAEDTNLFIAKLFDALQTQITGLGQRMDDRFERQDQQHEVDKQGAIARALSKDAKDDTKHAQNTVRLDNIEHKVDGSSQWIDGVGKPLAVEVAKIDGRVSDLENKRKVERAEARGGAKVWALIGGGVVAVGGAAWEYGRPILDAIMSKPHG